jgi:hypothetical protein
MNGADYIATTPLYGKKNHFYQQDGVVAEVGETCERVDPDSLPWLIDQGLIKTADDIITEDAATVPLADVLNELADEE